MLIAAGELTPLPLVPLHRVRRVSAVLKRLRRLEELQGRLVINLNRLVNVYRDEPLTTITAALS